MADAARGLGTGSLPVANVHALAETCNNGGGADDAPPAAVPGRYLSKDPSAEEVVAADDSTPAIPVIDFRKLLDPKSSSEECARLASACRHWGFFQVTANLMKDVAGFFKQPLEAKKECAQQPDSLEGYGQAFVVSEDQKLDWADMLYLIVQPRESRDMRFWPTRPASFRDSIDSYSLEASKVAYQLLEFMARGVGADPASLRGVFQGQVRGMRVNYYPPCRQAADRVLGLSPHSDPNGLTLLLQMNDPDVQGLQVRKDDDGRWFPVQVLDGAFVVNVGDALEIVSNGAFRSVEHRAVIHPTKERISAALFHFPDQDRMLGPLPELVKKGDRVRYRTTSYPDFLKQYFTAKLDVTMTTLHISLEGGDDDLSTPTINKSYIWYVMTSSKYSAFNWVMLVL